MSRRCVQQLADGETVEEIYLVSDRQVRANKNGAPYLQVDLRDRTGVVNAKLWKVAEAVAGAVAAGDFVRVKGKVQTFSGTLQMILTHIDRIDACQADLGEF